MGKYTKKSGQIKSINARIKQFADGVTDLSDFVKWEKENILQYAHKNSLELIEKKNKDGFSYFAIRDTKENRKKSLVITTLHKRTHERGKDYRKVMNKLNRKREYLNNMETMLNDLYADYVNGVLDSDFNSLIPWFGRESDENGKSALSKSKLQPLYDKYISKKSTVELNPPDTVTDNNIYKYFT